MTNTPVNRPPCASDYWRGQWRLPMLDAAHLGDADLEHRRRVDIALRMIVCDGCPLLPDCPRPAEPGTVVAGRWFGHLGQHTVGPRPEHLPEISRELRANAARLPHILHRAVGQTSILDGGM